MRLGRGSRNGSLSTRSEYKSHSSGHLPTDLHQEFSTNGIRCGCQPALSRCTVCCMLLMELKPQVRYGQHGHLLWSGTVAGSSEVL